MTKQTRLVMLSELRTIRLVCRKKDCQTTIEIPLDKITRANANGSCPSCGTEFSVGYGHEAEKNHPLHALADALRNLKYMDGENFAVEFPLDDSIGD